MPELPEVETVRSGLAPLISGHLIEQVTVRHRGLRWPVGRRLERQLEGRGIQGVGRRGKYLLICCDRGTLIVHLGMSGSLCVVSASTPAGKHDHLDVTLDDGRILRFNDPRRFGSVHWIEGDPLAHPLLAPLGLEPLAPDFDGDWLYRATRNRKAAIKHILMDSHLLAGIGNIYANEALFRAGIHPARSAQRVSLARYRRLAAAVRDYFGESTRRRWKHAAGLRGRNREARLLSAVLRGVRKGWRAVPVCGAAVRAMRQGQRSTFYCPHCQR